MYLFKKSIITRMGITNQPEPYLIRWTILFTIKLHHIIASDDDCMHDHPWTFISLILWGGYVEESPDENGDHINPSTGEISRKTLYHPGCILYRPASFIHRLEVYPRALTLVVTFKRVKEWGFFTRRGFIPWFNYQKQSHCD